MILTNDQQNALEKFRAFLTDPTDHAFVLSGYSGTGKSTLVRTLLDEIPSYIKMARLLNIKIPDYEVLITATTNKAADNLSELTGESVGTIHSELGLRVVNDYTDGTTKLIPKNSNKLYGAILFIDEASYIDSNLLDLIFKKTVNCKIVFIGDPAQLTPVKAVNTPVFDANFTRAHLSQVVRQADGNPIVDLSTKFRETVNTGQFFSFTPDGDAIRYLDRKDFNQAIDDEFTRPDWKYQDSKVLSWTNKCAVNYNHAINNSLSGTPRFQVGDYAICNKFITVNRSSIKTDELVHISGISHDEVVNDVVGNYYIIDHHIRVFGPKNLTDKNVAIKRARAMGDIRKVEEMENWIDLRAAYSCTINKSQGSTYDKVFIDLDDIKRCNSGNQIARMMYVGVSRARKNVFLTGDLV